MQNLGRYSSEPDNTTDSAFVRSVLRPIAARLQTGEPSATIDRLFESQHVKDLRLIVAAAFAFVGLILVVCVLLLLVAPIASLFTFYISVLGIFGAVLAWAYQVGSARLGVVDLFACEISTLCRVSAAFDTVRHCVERFQRGPPAARSGNGEAHVLPQAFTSEEGYFTVFENNTRDLESLEARVVVNITAFYTYMKAVRDAHRALAATKPQPAELESSLIGAPAGSWHEGLRNIVYMLFLGMESARHAVQDLVEFEPERAERTVVILISELEAFRFLCCQFPKHDVRHQRIMMRESEYGDLVPKLICSVEAHVSDGAVECGRGVLQWEPALLLLPELKKRYEDRLQSHGSAKVEELTSRPLRRSIAEVT